jgi:hypothetical protein
MNQWAFVIAAYAVVIAGTAAMALYAYGAMRSAEKRAEALRNRT